MMGWLYCALCFFGGLLVGVVIMGLLFAAAGNPESESPA
jgi:hypothetical protein